MSDRHLKYHLWTADELKALEQWDWERTNLYKFKSKAVSLGVSCDTLERAVWRARMMFRSQRFKVAL